MFRVNVLTRAIAEQFLSSYDSVDLSKYTEIELGAAEHLSKHQGILDLSGLKKLSEQAAMQLAKRAGGELRLRQVKFLSATAVEYLQGYQGKLDFDLRTLLKLPDFECMSDLADHVHRILQPEQTGTPGTITNCIGMKLIPITAGVFTMGSPNDEVGRHSSEHRHQVTLTRDFYLGLTPVTQSQFAMVMGEFPSNVQGDGLAERNCSEFPVDSVSWYDAVSFCKNLSDLADEKDAGRAYRLPSEAEWEYACRAGGSTAFCFGDGMDYLRYYAWYGDNSGRRPHPVGLREPNAWGVHDMHGNISEWCSDWSGAYPKIPVTDPAGPQQGTQRVHRGGKWYVGAASCRSAFRRSCLPWFRLNDLGFRVVMTVSTNARY